MLRTTSLSWKILLGVLPILLLALGISVVVQNHFQEKEMMDQAQTSALNYAAIIRESLVSMMINSQQVDTSYLQRVRSIQHFDSIGIQLNDLRLREELLSDEQLITIQQKRRHAISRDSVQQQVLRSGLPVYLRNIDQFRAVIPFNATDVCQKCHAVPIRYTLGAADIRFSLSRFTEASTDNWQRSLIIFLVFAVVVVGLATLMFTRYVAKPIDRLIAATNEIRKGNLASGILPARAAGAHGSRDEISYLGDRFDEMRESLADKIARLDEMNRALTKRNADVEEALERLHRAQEELVRSERLAATGRMAAQLSHEINNPIHNIQSLLESSLRRGDRTGEARELLELASDEIARMARLTRQLLDVYRGSVTELPQEPVDVGSIMLDVARTQAEDLSRRNVALTTDIQPGLGNVLGSRDKLKQVILNLVLNARDAMPDGGTITLRSSSDQAKVTLAVSDTGTGIRPEHRESVFDAFFTTKKAVSGVGLGLSVTYGIVQQHRGTIYFQSTVGTGTTFFVELPRLVEHEEQNDRRQT